MQNFAALIDALIYTRSRNGKLALIADYLRSTPDPDRGWALAALTDGLDFKAVKGGTIRSLAMTRVDPLLFQLSRDFVGDTAETVSLMWPEPLSQHRSPEPVEGRLADKRPSTGSGLRCYENAPTVSEAVEALAAMTRSTVNAELGRLLDRLDPNGRFALLKLATGAMRVGVSARLAKTALAQAFDLDLDDVEEVWHAVNAPYAELFAWAEGRGEKPDSKAVPIFRPFMLAHPLEDGTVDLADYAAEWKWDGIRVQLVNIGGQVRIYSRGGEEITGAFPEVARAFDWHGVLDGELLVRGSHQGGEEGGAASFNALQQRLGRKTVSAKMLADYPAFVRLYDILFDGTEDCRALGWEARRARLELVAPQLPESHFDLSQIIEARDFAHLAEIREAARDAAIEGVMLKRRDAPYVAGRRVGLWYKWKRDPLVADCVLMYAQRGSGKRSSFYSDYTFGCWTADPADGGELTPVGKAYSGFTDEELKWLDSFVRRNTTARFGPVREVEKSLVFEVAFDAVQESKRHKSGIAMRFPRISRIRKDKPAEEANLVADLRAMIG